MHLTLSLQFQAFVESPWMGQGIVRCTWSTNRLDQRLHARDLLCKKESLITDAACNNSRA